MGFTLPKVKGAKLAKPGRVPSRKKEALTKIVKSKSSGTTAQTKSFKATVSAGKSALALLKKLKKGKGIL